MTSWLRDKTLDEILELPDIETVKEIFIELEDTKKYSLKFLPFDYDSRKPGIYNDSDILKYCITKPDIPRAFDTIDWYDRMTGTTINMSFEEKTIRVTRRKWRIVIEFLDGVDHKSDEVLKDVIERIKSYLGDNIENVYLQPGGNNWIIIDTLIYQVFYF